jgi:hypothetical protein
MKEHIKDNILNIVRKNAKKVNYISEEQFINECPINENMYIKFKNNNTIEYTNNNYIRKELFLNIFEEKILPYISIKNNFIININLHDICNKDGVLTFGNKSNSNSILIPDIYQMYNYKDSLKPENYDKIDFKNKLNKIIFGGATTGNINLNFNDRINTCIWGNTNYWGIKNTYFKLTNIVQIPENMLYIYTKKHNLNMNSITCNNISISEQLKYKYILSIDGNTWAWDRPVWIMNSNSLFFKYESDNNGWYYDFLQEDIHYVSVNTNNMEKKYNFFENNSNQALEIINNSKNFIKDYCSENAWTFYFKSLLEEIDFNV